MAGPQSDQLDDGAEGPSSSWQRLKVSANKFIFKAADPGMDKAAREAADPGPTTVDELEQAVKKADDKERLIGLFAAPIAAAIAVLVTSSLIANNPPAQLNGHTNPLHHNPSVYSELGAVALVLALLMLGFAWYRKRMYLGIVMALYGLSIFNLKFWGFGLPYIMCGAWLLVRSYRLQTKLKLAKAEESPGGGSGASVVRPQASKRYTPPTS